MKNYGKNNGKKGPTPKPANKPQSTMSATADMFRKAPMVGKKKK